MSKKKSPGRGGKRDGAGRPPINPEGATTLVTVTVPQALMDRLDGMATANSWNRSEAVTQAIRAFVAKR